MKRNKALHLAGLAALAVSGHTLATDYVDSTTDIPATGQSGGEQAVHDAKSYAEQQRQTQALQDQLKTMAAQLDELKQQSQEQKQQTDAMTGSNGMGNLQTQDYAASVPRDWHETLEASKSVDKVVSAADNMQQQFESEEDAYRGLSDKDAVDKLLNDGVKRAMNGAALNATAYDASVDRVKALDELKKQIGQAKTVKEAADLQARIQVENSMINNELIRTQAMNALLQHGEYARAYLSQQNRDETGEDGNQ